MPFLTAAGVPAGRIGQGTWCLGEDPATQKQELAALRTGIEAGMTLLDTAEMYGDGASEALVGQAVRPYARETLYLVSKVYPFNAGRANIFASCEASLRRLGTDYLDLYLLHWRGRVPLAETAECMEELKAKGRIRAWGVSNLDTDDMRELLAVPGGANCAADQLLYHLGSRGIEYDLMPLLAEHGIAVMAYCPLAQAGRLRRGLSNNAAVQSVAAAHAASAQQVLLAFLLTRPDVVPIPRTAHAAHAAANAVAADLTLTPAELAALEAAFPAPDHKVELDMQ